MNREQRFWNRLAEKYSKQPISDEVAYAHKLETMRDYLDPDGDLLEFGCGTGGAARWIAPHVRQVTGLDISDEMIRIARERTEAAGLENVAFEQGDFGNYDSPPERYEAVLAMSILHLLDDRDVAIRRVFGLLKPGGVFVSSTVCMGNSLWFFYPIIPIGRAIGLFPLLRVFTRGALRKSIEAAGFTVEYAWKQETSPVLFVIARKPG